MVLCYLIILTCLVHIVIVFYLILIKCLLKSFAYFNCIICLFIIVLLVFFICSDITWLLDIYGTHFHPILACLFISLTLFFGKQSIFYFYYVQFIVEKNNAFYTLRNLSILFFFCNSVMASLVLCISYFFKTKQLCHFMPKKSLL